VIVARFAIVTVAVEVNGVVCSSDVADAEFDTTAAVVPLGTWYVTVIVAVEFGARWASEQLMDCVGEPQLKAVLVTAVTCSRESTVSVATRLSASE